LLRDDGVSSRTRFGVVLVALALSLAGAGTEVQAGGDRASRPRAAIDIGSSGIKLLVVKPSGKIVHDEKVGASLGKGIGPDRLLPKANQERAKAALEHLIRQAKKHDVRAREIRVVATAAVRDANGRADAAAKAAGKRNGRGFIRDAVRSPSGLGLRLARVLSGVVEAELGFRGALRGWPGARDQKVVVIDTGGGSHQVTVGSRAGGIEAGGSTPVGSNRVKETVLVDDQGAELDTLTPTQLAAADQRLAALIPRLPIDAGKVTGAPLLLTGGVAKFLFHHFRASTVTRAQLVLLRQQIAGLSPSMRERWLSRDIHGDKLSKDERRLLGFMEVGDLNEDYGGKATAKLSIVLRLMDLAGGQQIQLTQTDVRHYLADAR
jgi:hypothetical protein